MKKTLVSILLATFFLSLPVVGNARGADSAVTAAAQTANSSILPMLAQFRRRRWRLRRARRYRAERRYERRAYRRHRFIWRHRRRR
jgi:hypothetical protein